MVKLDDLLPNFIIRKFNANERHSSNLPEIFESDCNIMRSNRFWATAYHIIQVCMHYIFQFSSVHYVNVVHRTLKFVHLHRAH